MTKFWQKQIQEIQADWSLPFYGAALSLTHVWTYMYWARYSFFVNSQSRINAEPICFPFFPSCDLFRDFFSPQTWQVVLFVYLALAVATTVFFFTRNLVPIACKMLAGLTLFKFLLHMSNYNFMGNYHYMAYFVTLAYLLLPHKKSLIKYLIVVFYIAAGSLKINIDWLSGAAMIRLPFVSGSFYIFSLFYVVLLELVLIFGVLSSKNWVRWITFAQLLAFHAFSWHIVGFYYPLVMFSILSLFFLDEWLFLKKGVTVPPLLTDLFQRCAPKVVYTTLGLFILMQLLPFIMVSDASLSGAPRLSSLNMFDSKTHCHAIYLADTERGQVHLQAPEKNLGVRLKCDPLIFLNQAHQLCRKNKDYKEIKKLSLALFSRRVTEKKYTKVLDIKDVCSLEAPLWAEITGGDS